MNNLEEQTHEFLEEVRHARSSFYRDLWGQAKEFNSLPTVERSDFYSTPLNERVYKESRSYAKLVFGDNSAFTSAWAFEDTVQEPFGTRSNRPVVYMKNAHEALEKGIWCYGNGMVPLVAEQDSRIAAFCARRYKGDSLITDTSSHIGDVMSVTRNMHLPLQSISLIGSAFDVEELLELQNYARSVRLVLAIEEVGVLAEAELEKNPIFRASPGTIIQFEETIVVTKQRLLTTPIIRYKTPITGVLLETTNSHTSFHVV